jgi:hypothetical protein
VAELTLNSYHVKAKSDQTAAMCVPPQVAKAGIEPDPEPMSTGTGRRRASKWFWWPQDRNTEVSTKAAFSN